MKDHYEEKSGETRVKDGLDLPSICMPDNGCIFDYDRMVDMGYTDYIDTQRCDRDYVTRWWFRDEHNRERVLKAIKAQGFEVVTINP